METKERILKAAEELFFRYGIRSVTMDDICTHLGISKKTIYQFFANKDEVVFSLMESMTVMRQKDFQKMSKAAAHVVEEVMMIMKHMSEMVGKVNPNVFYDMQKHHPKAWELFKKFKEECVQQMVEKSLERGIKEGLVRTDINAKILSRLRMEEVEMGFNPVLFPPDKFKVVDVQLALIEHFLYGICTVKGHKLINRYRQINEDEN